MPEENLIHIKLDYSEALQSKKDMLASEMSALRIAKHIKAYKYHKSNKLDLKIGLYKKIKELKNLIINLQKVLPKLHMPEILRKEGYTETDHKTESKAKKEVKDSSIEDQLWEIQRRLNELQSR